MTTEQKTYASKVGPKGQVVIPKELRQKYGIAPGSEVEQIDTGNGVLIRHAELIAEWQGLAIKIGKKWPKTLSSVEAIRKDREKLDG